MSEEFSRALMAAEAGKNSAAVFPVKLAELVGSQRQRSKSRHGSRAEL